jgi:hypothetical protein
MGFLTRVILFVKCVVKFGVFADALRMEMAPSQKTAPLSRDVMRVSFLTFLDRHSPLQSPGWI